jgi:hypothetical protein
MAAAGSHTRGEKKERMCSRSPVVGAGVAGAEEGAGESA